MNRTENPPGSQSQNRFSRIPDELWPKLLRLSPAEAKLFLLLNSKANRKREPVGVVDANVSAIASVWMQTSRGAVRRSLRRLDAAGLVDYVRRPTSSGSAIRVRHYLDHHDPYVDHHDPPPLDHHDPPADHHDPPLDHHDPVGGSSRSTKSPQTSERQEVPEPLYVGTYRNDGDEGFIAHRQGVVAAKERQKPQSSSSPPGFFWDEENKRIWGDEGSRKELKELWQQMGLENREFLAAWDKLNSAIATKLEPVPLDPGARLNKYLMEWKANNAKEE